MTSSPILCVYFSSFEAMAYLFTNASRIEAYRTLGQLAAERGLELRIACGDQFQGSLLYSEGWRFQEGELQKVITPFTASAIFCVGPGAGAIPIEHTTDLIVNSPAMDAIGRDKLKQYGLLADFIATTFAIDRNNWQEVIAKLQSTKIVLKPVVGSEGDGVKILEKTQLTAEDIPESEAYLAQEFVETVAGIPGLTDTRHDLRVVLFNGEIKFSFVRTPKEGTLLANVALGGSKVELSPDQIPVEVADIAKAVDQRFRQYKPRLMAVDFLVTPERPYVTEINTRPSFPRLEFYSPEYCNAYYVSLLDIIIDELKVRRRE